MSELLLAIMLVVPLILATAQGLGPRTGWLDHLTAWAALPGLLLALWGTDFSHEVPWLLLGSQLGLDLTGRIFLGLTAGLWLAAGVYAKAYLADDPRGCQFQVFFLVTMTGNLGVTVAQDGISFLTFFTLMSLAAYGLIVHDRLAASLRAGKVYIVMTVVGEMLLLVAMVLLAVQTESVRFEGLAERLTASAGRDWIIGLLLAGFGIKLGIMPLHVWLPLAHPAAPTPASAVLSGVMIKTGLLGLLRTLPLGTEAFTQWGTLCLAVGIATCFFAAFIGMLQGNPKAVLAYSSISQMGLILLTLAIALIAPAAWPVVGTVLLIWVVHHGLAKSALFFGVGIAGAAMPAAPLRGLFMTTLALPALALTGLPLTLGFTAKGGAKYASTMMEPSSGVLAWVFLLSTASTTLLVLRFLWLVWPTSRPIPSHSRPAAGMLVPWAILCISVSGSFFYVQFRQWTDPAWSSLAGPAVWASSWPILAAIASTALMIRPLKRWKIGERISIPAGDICGPIALLANWILRPRNLSNGNFPVAEKVTLAQPPWVHHFSGTILKKFDELAALLENDTIAALIFALLAVVLLLTSLG